MSWFDRFFKRQKSIPYADLLSGRTPIYSQYGRDIFYSDVVRQAIKCVVDEMVKLNPKHIKVKDGQEVQISGEIAKLLEFPNPLMGKSDLIEKLCYQLLTTYNAFAIPVYKVWVDKSKKQHKVYTAIYPVAPSQVEFLQDNTDTIFVCLKFTNGFNMTIPYSECIHIRYNFSQNELLGGNASGGPDNYYLSNTLNINDSLLNGIEKSITGGLAINGIVKYHGLINEQKVLKNIREFEAKIRNSESGILPMDDSGDYIPIQKDSKIISSDILKFIDEKILRTWGVSLAILTGDYTKAQYEAFYQKTLEPLIIKFSEAFTRAIFSDGELNHGNRIKFYPRDLIFMSATETLEMIRLLGDSGSLYENEKRVALGLQPLEELDGVRMQSLNYVDVDLAKTYQTGGQNEE